MDQLEFLSALIQEPETKYNARGLHENYKYFHAAGNYGVAMTEHTFFRKLKEINGVTHQRTNSCVVYHFDKAAMQKYLEGLSLDMRKLKRADDGNQAQKR